MEEASQRYRDALQINYEGGMSMINDKELTALSRAATADVIGEARVIDLERPMNSQRKTLAYSGSGKPGNVYDLKAGNAGHYAPLHNPASTLNEGYNFLWYGGDDRDSD